MVCKISFFPRKIQFCVHSNNWKKKKEKQKQRKKVNMNIFYLLVGKWIVLMRLNRILKILFSSSMLDVRWPMYLIIKCVRFCPKIIDSDA